jgi:3',5'-cyclic AMP phosphodiesterase CpdA
MTTDRLNILVISDLHAHSGDPGKSDAPSFLSTNALFDTPEINPMSSIADLIKREHLQVNWIISPGDLGDKAEPACQAYAWQRLKSVRDEVGASHLIATAGNHDIDSRRMFPAYDPKSALQKLVPGFPVDLDCYGSNDQVFIDRFWSRNFVIVPVPDFDCTLLVINSCAFHGYSSDVKKAPNEHLRGKISPLTRAAIEKAISSLSTRLNIALMHHHLVTHPYLEDDSRMIGGHELLDTFKSTKKQWLVIHGHQHVPLLSYSDADPFAPVVLSSGSVAAKTYRVKGGHARNQIHHISIALSEMERTGLEVLGRVRSWSWAYEHGWQKASPDGGIPYKCGFGYRFDPRELRDQLAAEVQSAYPRVVDWREVVDRHPRLDYLAPGDRKALIEMIEAKGVAVELDPFAMPTRLEWRA